MEEEIIAEIPATEIVVEETINETEVTESVDTPTEVAETIVEGN